MNDDNGSITRDELFGTLSFDYSQPLDMTTTTTTTSSLLNDEDIFNELDDFITPSCSSTPNKYLASPPTSPLLSPLSFEDDDHETDYTDFPLFS